MAIIRRKKKSGEGRISQATAQAEAHRKVMARTPPGAGGRFASLKAKLGKRKGIRAPGALAAWIGRRKYKTRFQKMAAAGRRAG